MKLGGEKMEKKTYEKPKVSELKVLEKGRAFYGVLACGCGCGNQRPSPWYMVPLCIIYKRMQTPYLD